MTNHLPYCRSTISQEDAVNIAKYLVEEAKKNAKKKRKKLAPECQGLESNLKNDDPIVAVQLLECKEGIEIENKANNEKNKFLDSLEDPIYLDDGASIEIPDKSKITTYDCHENKCEFSFTDSLGRSIFVNREGQASTLKDSTESYNKDLANLRDTLESLKNKYGKSKTFKVDGKKLKLNPDKFKIEYGRIVYNENGVTLSFNASGDLLSSYVKSKEEVTASITIKRLKEQDDRYDEHHYYFYDKDRNVIVVDRYEPNIQLLNINGELLHLADCLPINPEDISIDGSPEYKDPELIKPLPSKQINNRDRDRNTATALIRKNVPENRSEYKKATDELILFFSSDSPSDPKKAKEALSLVLNEKGDTIKFQGNTAYVMRNGNVTVVFSIDYYKEKFTEWFPSKFKLSLNGYLTNK